MKSVFIFGRQPQLGLAEIESLYGNEVICPIENIAATIDISPCLIDFNRLGGSIKFAKLLTELPTTSWQDIENFLLTNAANHSKSMPIGKMHLGISVYGFKVSPAKIMSTGLKIKKSIRATGRNVHLIPNKETTLNSAQIIYNKLTAENGWELLIIKGKHSTTIAQTIQVQDIEKYSKRDQTRPKRDSRVGMLPPKLAQIIINLAVGKLTLPPTSSDNCQDFSKFKGNLLYPRILDPFCGSGVIMQEALLMGYSVIGSDIEPRMVDYCLTNLDWFKDNFKQFLPESTFKYNITCGNALVYKWPPDIRIIASETYLGRPFNTPPTQSILDKTIKNTNHIISNFLINWRRQTSSSRLSIAVPAWQIKPNTFIHLPLIDQLSRLGYNRISFKHLKVCDLIYYRPDQVVAREILVLESK